MKFLPGRMLPSRVRVVFRPQPHPRPSIVPRHFISLEYLLRSLVGLAAWTLLGLLGMEEYTFFHGTSPVWPASGLGLAMLILWGPRYWPSVALGSIIISIAGRVSPAIYLPLTLTSTVEVAGAAWLLRRLRFDASLSRPRDVVRLAVLTVPFTLASAAGGVALLYAGGSIPGSEVGMKISVWAFGNFLGVLLVAPTLLVWAQPFRRTLSLRRWAEVALLAVGTALVCRLLFFQHTAAASSRMPLAFLTFPFVVLAGLRFGLRGGTLITLLVAGLAVVATAQGHGVFVAQNHRDSTLLLMMFEGMLALTALFVGATTNDQHRQADELRLSEQLLQGQAESNRLLLASTTWQEALPRVLTTLGAASRSDRISVYRLDRPAPGRTTASLVDLWCAPGVRDVRQLPLLRDFDFVAHGLGRWLGLLEEGHPLSARLADLPAIEAGVLARLDLQSFLLAPVHIEERCWGFLALESCRQVRAWTAQESATLQAVATNIGIAIRRDQLRDELAASVTRYRALLSALPDSYLLHDSQGRVLDCHIPNDAALWQPAAAFIGRTHHENHPPEVAALIQDGFARVAALGRPVVLQYALTLPGGIRHFEERIVRAEGDRFLSIVRDLTEQRQAERERQRIEAKLREMQKLESLGVLAGGIAHDFNNLLTAILGNASLARHILPPGAEAGAMLGQIESAAHRAADLCRQMLAYAGRGQFTIERADLSQLANDTLPLLQLSISKRAHLELEYADAALPVLIDVTQIRQVLMNLILNSAEAIGEKGGTVTLRTGRMRADAAYLAEAHSAADAQPGDFHFLEVADTGSGMTPETLAHIFDPFFTTKFTGRGLGLAAVLGIVHGHHGALHVDSAPGRGSTFRVLLPPAPAAAARPAEAPAPAVVAGGRSGTVLVVDDEDHVRESAAALLRKLGYQTVEVADGQSAVADFRTHPEAFKFALLDLTMPGMDGSETLAELQRVRPDLPALVMSGYSEQETLQRLKGRGVRAFLPKPFTVEMLVARLEQAGV
jgi:signal transduction histidine kinase/integral membrane sensor domain MASE1/CheY-like chemotaxis protein